VDSKFLVIALDEVDRVFQYETVFRDFLGMLQAWHEMGKNKPLWQKLQLILAHSQEVYIQLDIIMKQIVKTQHPIVIESNIGFKLKTVDLIRFTDDNEVEPRLDLYRQYFRNIL
jgi:hypothetical protein